jgi:heat-inducible transcriptional repressor
MEERVELGPRKAAVLRAVVEEYVRTGEPVGSETVFEHHDLGVSPATIRSEMAALEELGYLTHPHTSAGRAPTTAGYRRFVDALPARARLPDAHRRTIARFFEQTATDMEEVLHGTTRLLSRLTLQAGLAVPPATTDERVLRAELIELGSAVLLLLVGEHGRVYKAVLERPEGLDAAGLEHINERVRALADRTLAAAAARAHGQAAEAPMDERPLLRSVAEGLAELQRRSEEVHVLVGGVGNLAAEVASWRRETMQRLLDALERESEVLALLREASLAEDLMVTIGPEHPATGLWDASVVAAPYRSGDLSLGSIAVVGPTRMDYGTAMAAVRAVARRLSEIATGLGA